MNKTRLIILAIMLLLSVMGYAVTAQSSDQARDFLYIGIDPQTLNGGRNSDLYLVRSDGSRVTNLTNTPLDSENQAFWSADGKKIYFSRNSVAIYQGSSKQQSSTSFYVMDISDTGNKISERLLFHLDDIMSTPIRVDDWLLSSDEQNLMFIAYDKSLGGIYIVNLDGTNIRELVEKGVASTYIPFQWSPDSKEFAYKSECLTTNRNSNCPYWVKQLDSDNTPEPMNTEQDLMHRWHPDKPYVITNAGSFEIHQGNEVVWRGNERPYLSPDGTQVAFSEYSNTTLKGTLITIDVKTNKSTHIVETDGTILLIEWSLNSQQIAFGAYQGSFNDLEIYTVKPDGTELKKLFRRQSWNPNALAWRPDPQTKVG